LTIARKDCRCSRCRLLLKRNGELVYRHEPREVRCLRCASRDPESKGFKPSIRWERAKARQQQTTTSSASPGFSAGATTTSGNLNA
jgi:hypothetical protein